MINFFNDGGLGFQFPARMRFCSSLQCPDWLWDPPNVLFSCYQSFFPLDVKWLGCETGYSSPSGSEIMIRWS